MRCPRCKGENNENSLVCSHCELKLKSTCPRCKSLNKIGQSVCANCNLRLIRFCPQCKSPNFPNATNCRKCNFELRKAKNHLSPEISNQKQENKALNLQKQADSMETQDNSVIAATDTTISQNIEQPVSNEAIQAQQSEKPADSHPKTAKTAIKELSRAEVHDSIINGLKASEQGMILDLSAPDGSGKSTLVSSIVQVAQDQNFVWLIGECQPANQLLPYSFFQDLFRTLLGLPLFVSNIDESRVALDKF